MMGAPCIPAANHVFTAALVDTAFSKARQLILKNYKSKNKRTYSMSLTGAVKDVKIACLLVRNTGFKTS